MVDQTLRSILARLCRDLGGRINGPNLDVPNRWWPHRVRDPETGMRFTEDGAWHFIADLLEAGALVKPCTLKRPPIPAHYMLVEGEVEERRIYIKIALFPSGAKVLGVSFHYSNEEYRNDD